MSNNNEIQKFLMGDFGDRFVKFHSTYKGWDLYREWNVYAGHGMMSYFAVMDGKEPLHAENLMGIKHAVSLEVE